MCSQHWTLPVIVLVARGDTKAQAEAHRFGATAVLELPVDEENVRAEILSLVQLSS